MRKVPSDIALVGVHFVEQARDNATQSLAIINIADRDPDGQQFALMVDHGMQLEAIKPAGGRFAALGDALETPVALNAQVVANGQWL